MPRRVRDREGRYEAGDGARVGWGRAVSGGCGSVRVERGVGGEGFGGAAGGGGEPERGGDWRGRRRGVRWMVRAPLSAAGIVSTGTARGVRRRRWRRECGRNARNLLQEGTSTRDFGTIIRVRRKERGLTQKQLAAQITVEGRPISQSNLADLERGFAPARPHLIEEFARVLEINRDLLYLAADIVPPEVAEELRRLTPEEREMAWGAFKKVVAEARAEKMRQQERVNARPASATAKVKKNKKAS